MIVHYTKGKMQSINFLIFANIIWNVEAEVITLLEGELTWKWMSSSTMQFSYQPQDIDIRKSSITLVSTIIL